MEGIEIVQHHPLLIKAFKYIIDFSKSNYLPYHNLNHLLTVLKYSDMIAHGEGVYFDQRTPLHLAALFHDDGDMRYYIIECGCMNSVGFYHADINTYVKKITEWIEK